MPYKAIHNDECSKTVSFDKEKAMKWFLSTQTTSLSNQPSVLNDEITDRETEKIHKRTPKHSDKPTPNEEHTR